MSPPESPFSPEKVDATVQHTHTVLILDTSGTMGYSPRGSDKERIELLNEGLQHFKKEITDDEFTKRRIDVSIVTFGGKAKVEEEFAPVKDWTPPTLSANGTTPMSDAIDRAIDLVDDTKERFKREDIRYYRPVIWLITDGKPDMDEGSPKWNSIKELLEYGTDNQKFLFFALGLDNSDVSRLNRLVEVTGNSAVELHPGQFREFFEFASNSLNRHSREGGDASSDWGDPEE